MVIEQERVDAALAVLSSIEPKPLAMNWEYQDGFTTVLFFVNVPDQSELSVQRTYFKQVVPQLSALIPDVGDLPNWMLFFQDATGHMITSCTSFDQRLAL